MGELRSQTTLFCAFVAMAIAISMLLRGRRPLHWLFAAFATDIACWYAAQSLSQIAPSPIWIRATGVLTILLPLIAILLFQSVLPFERDDRSSRLRRLGAVLAVPMLVLVLSPYDQTPVGLGLTYFYVVGLLVASLVSLELRGRRNPSRAVRDRTRFLVLVSTLAVTFTLGDFLSFLGVFLPPIGAVLSIIFLFVLSESLTRPRLADLYEMAGRLMVFTALAFCLAGVFYLFVALIGRFSTIYLNAVLVAIVFLLLFEPLQTFVESRIHQFYFRERHAIEVHVEKLKARLAHVLEVDEMVQALLEGMNQLPRLTAAGIYLRDQDASGFERVGGIGIVPARLDPLTSAPIVERLAVDASINLEEVARDADKNDAPIVAAAQQLGSLERSVMLAVRGSDDDLVGIIAIADERVRDAFSPEEVTLFETVASQIGVAIANSRVYTRMKERDRLAALGAMAAGLAHEVKNPLGSIKGAAQLLEEILEGGDGGKNEEATAREFAGIILEEVNRLDRVVGTFLDYARPNVGDPVPIDINAAVRRTLRILSSQQTDNVDLVLELGETIPRASIDPEKFRQVLMNLVRNAIQAIDGAGRVTVATSHRKRGVTVRGDSAAISADGAARDAGWVEVSVRDTGPGISALVLKYLFIPFFTTKDRGTGLGLALSQSIIQNAGGTIEVHTPPGAGATFTVVLPAEPEIESPRVETNVPAA